jgi:hypothetical protein
MPTPSDVTYEEFVLFLKHKGFSEQTNSSSHYIYGCKMNNKAFLIAFVRPHGASKYMKRSYIRNAIEIIDAIENQSEMG